MNQYVNFNQMKVILTNVAGEIVNKKDYLSNLDSSCGDGDLGVVMYKAFQKGVIKLEEEKDGDISRLFITLGSEIIASAGGASGPLFGTIFLEAGRSIAGKERITLEDFAIMFEKSLAKVKALGGAEIGDKTLIDAFEPAVKALRNSLSKGFNLKKALNLAAKEAMRGTGTTKCLVARHGKAKYIGDKSLGFIDPGAKVIQIIFETIISSYESVSHPRLRKE